VFESGGRAEIDWMISCGGFVHLRCFVLGEGRQIA
jgi:hypothetical protein